MWCVWHMCLSHWGVYVMYFCYVCGICVVCLVKMCVFVAGV